MLVVSLSQAASSRHRRWRRFVGAADSFQHLNPPPV